MLTRTCPEHASGSGLGETRPLTTATHQVDHGGLAGHGADSWVRRGDRRCRPAKKLRLSATFPFGIGKKSDLRRTLTTRDSPRARQCAAGSPPMRKPVSLLRLHVPAAPALAHEKR
eukprot:3282753-Prymnesium_polylepis.1